MRLRKLAALFGAAALTFGAVGAVSATAPTHHKITICHATSSETNPYTIPTVDIASAGYPDNTSGHASHGNDGVWYPGAKADGFDWGDIIPPYDYGDFHYDGLNWTEAGQAIYNNDCNAPKETHDPAIHIVKTPSVTDLPDTGGPVTYTYVVTNTGDVELSNVSVSDDKCSPVDYVSGDTNDDELLDLSETWTFSCTTTLTETTTNVATATGHDGDTAVTDDDQATVTLADPPAEGYLKILKEVDGGDFSGDFGFHADCGNGGSFDVTVTYPDPGSVTIDDIPAGSVCDVTETTMPAAPAGFHWGEPDVSENPATIKDEDTVWVHFVNHLIPDGVTPGLTLGKSNNAPLVGGLPTANEGDTVTYTLDYTVANGPLTNGVLTDVLPAGVTYTAGTATDSTEFEFVSYDSGTRTLTWDADTVTMSGSVTYQATIDTGAAALTQPLTNTATIDSEETSPDSDTSNVFVAPPPHGETFQPTPPPTDAAGTSGDSSATTGTMLLVLLVLVGVGLAMVFAGPTPDWIRNRRR
jgi:fimbrial isopeptide formation D2 family protein/uncharacterized repeat protein (TIGR01451 family)